MLDFGKTCKEEGMFRDVLKSYDNSSMFIGYSVCLDLNPYPEINPSTTSGGGYDAVSISKGINFGLNGLMLEVTIHNAPGKLVAPARPPGNSKNITIEQINILGYNATYTGYEENYGTRSREQPKNREEAKEFILNFGHENPHYLYRQNAYLYIPLDEKTELTLSMKDLPQNECFKLFKSLNITKVIGENPRYWIDKGNRLFQQSMYEDAIAAYNNITSGYETSEVIDNKGIALYKLGKYNETYEWFTWNRPRTSRAWYIHGKILDSMGLDAEAEYAFDKAAKTSS
jgi:tetratricopeptide (TPR) repeat protein